MNTTVYTAVKAPNDEEKGRARLDYIDAPAIRDHLRRFPPLPPAQQCILIAQSDIKPLGNKLAALREIRAATPPEDFSRGCWAFHEIRDGTRRPRSPSGESTDARRRIARHARQVFAG